MKTPREWAAAVWHEAIDPEECAKVVREIQAEARAAALEEAAKVADDMLALWRRKDPSATWQDCAAAIRALKDKSPA